MEQGALCKPRKTTRGRWLKITVKHRKIFAQCTVHAQSMTSGQKGKYTEMIFRGICFRLHSIYRENIVLRWTKRGWWGESDSERREWGTDLKCWTSTVKCLKVKFMYRNVNLASKCHTFTHMNWFYFCYVCFCLMVCVLFLQKEI